MRGSPGPPDLGEAAADEACAPAGRPPHFSPAVTPSTRARGEEFSAPCNSTRYGMFSERPGRPWRCAYSRSEGVGADLPRELLLLPVPGKGSRNKSAPTEKPRTYGMFGESGPSCERSRGMNSPPQEADALHLGRSGPSSQIGRSVQLAVTGLVLLA